MRPRRHGWRHRGRWPLDRNRASNAEGPLLWWAWLGEGVQGPSRRSGSRTLPEAELESLGAAILGMPACRLVPDASQTRFGPNKPPEGVSASKPIST